MNENDSEELNLLFFNIILTLVYIGSLSYNKIMRNLHKKSFFNTKKENFYNLDNRILVVLLTLGYFYINIKIDIQARKKGQNCKNFDLQVLASIFTFISVMIVLYVSYQEYKDRDNNLADYENPGL